jgi:phosphoglucosamine mutase
MSVKDESRKLSELGRLMTIFPQVLMNVTVGKKTDIETIPEISEAIRSVESKLGDTGRVLVRYSGTQPLCRVMVEGPDMDETGRLCKYLSDIIKNNLNG